ncbi:MAG TPA: glycosyltransferase [Candidatus Egerieimonas intestinavium]|uniref:Glycosyltransferase n=1 Tax=Candidatus Egerieimonas intestinavium TaxID=2840777 RepID=A0A9D1EK54_9FIRM|nr:glycosyltransferase [Candidatus Egerieimonas intestinavium]
MKILILSCKTGGGHDAAGFAVKEALEARGHEAYMFDYLTLAGEKVSETVGDIYVNTVQKMPHVFGLVYRMGMVISRITRKSPVYYVNAKMGKYLQAYMEQEHFDAVVMPHLYPAETITYMKRKGMELPLTLAVMTDYTCIPFWEETDCDYYIAPHRELVEQCVRRGIPEEKLIPLGIPVGEKFLKKADKKKARSFLELPREGRMYLLMGGSMGAGDLEKLTKELVARLTEGEFLAVICGNNRKVFQRMKKKYQDREEVYLVGKTRQMDMYMKACDIIYTKPGGLTSTEAAVSRIPIIHTAPIPGCETANRRFFVKHGMSAAPRTIEGQVKKGRELLDNPARAEEMQKAQREHISGQTARRIAEFIEEKA